MNKQRFTLVGVGLFLLFLIVIPVTVFAQDNGKVWNLTCQGQFYGYQAMLTGQEQDGPDYTGLGDFKLIFHGTLTIQGWEYPLEYEDYSSLPPYEGYIQLGQGQVHPISVLSNSGGRFIIYEGGEILYAPETLGEFVCSWQLVGR